MTTHYHHHDYHHHHYSLFIFTIVVIGIIVSINVTVVNEGDDLPAVVQVADTKTEPGVDLVIVRIDPDHEMAVRRSITTAVGEAING